MELVPYYGEERLSFDRLVVQVNPADRKRIAELVRRAAEIPDNIQDKEDYDSAHKMARELKAASSEINASKRQAKIPLEAVLNAIEGLAKEVSQPVNEESHRILAMMSAYVQHLEEVQKAAERKRKEDEERNRQEAERIIALAQKAKAEAEARAKAALTELEREKALKEAAGRDLEAARMQLERQLTLEVLTLSQEPVKGLVPNGRVDHRWKFRLVDPAKTVVAGQVRLLRIEINHLACQDKCKEQVEKYPDKEPTLPGIEVTRQTSVSVKPSVRT